MTVRALGQTDNEALLRLASRRSTGRSEFRVDRAPDFFALGRRFGDTNVYGAFRGDALVASVSVSKQRRFVDGVEMRVTYLHDLRTDPNGSAHAFVALVRDVLRRELVFARWAFATVLSGNPMEVALVSAVGRMFGSVRTLAATAHVALAPSGRASALDVTELDADAGARLYMQWAARRCFAPADPCGWSYLSGRWLVASRAGEPVAVTLAARETDRRIITTANGCPVDVGFLAFACTHDPADDAQAEDAFVAYLSHAPWASFGVTCRGRAPSEPARGHVLLASTTYVFGPAPRNLSVELPELTLM
jgi:hypothetical protein